MTTLSLALTKLGSLILTTLGLGVSFGWAPADETQTAGRQPAAERDAYEYLVQITPADLEAIRAGKVTDLRSYLPEGVGPFDRVRIVFDEKPLPRTLTRADASSPRVIATRGAKRQTVAKPVVPSAWRSVPAEGDSDGRSSDGQSSDPQRQTTFQNPGVLDFDRFTEGVRDSTAPLAEAGRSATEWTGDQLRGLGDGVRDATQNGLQGTSDALRSLLPPDERGVDVGLNGQSQTVPPPAYQTRPAQAQVDPQTGADWRTSNVPAYPNNQPAPNNQAAQNDRQSTTPDYRSTPDYPPAVDPYRQQAAAPRDDFDAFDRSGPELGNPGGIATEFGRTSNPGQGSAPSAGYPDFRANERGALTPVQRSTPNATPSQQDPWDNRGFASETQHRTDRPAGGDPGWPAQRPTNPAYTTPPTYSPTAATTPPATTPPAATPTAAAGTGWGMGAAAPDFASGDDRQNPDAPRIEQTAGVTSGDVWDKILLVGLAGMNVYVWLSYIDVRNKYRSVLRRNPSGYDHTLAA